MWYLIWTKVQIHRKNTLLRACILAKVWRGISSLIKLNRSKFTSRICSLIIPNQYFLKYQNIYYRNNFIISYLCTEHFISMNISVMTWIQSNRSYVYIVCQICSLNNYIDLNYLKFLNSLAPSRVHFAYPRFVILNLMDLGLASYHFFPILSYEL